MPKNEPTITGPSCGWAKTIAWVSLWVEVSISAGATNPTRSSAVTEPADLPLTETTFRTVVVEATLRCRKETPLAARIEGRWTETNEPVDLECRIVGVTQGLIEPTNSQFPIEASLTVDADGETYTVGGEGAFIEDIEAERVTLSEA